MAGKRAPFSAPLTLFCFPYFNLYGRGEKQREVLGHGHQRWSGQWKGNGCHLPGLLQGLGYSAPQDPSPHDVEVGMGGLFDG